MAKKQNEEPCECLQRNVLVDEEHVALTSRSIDRLGVDAVAHTLRRRGYVVLVPSEEQPPIGTGDVLAI